jgi:acetyl esterase
VDPQVERLIAMLKAATPADAPKMWQLTVADARARSELFFALFNEGGPAMAEVRTVAVPGRRGAIRARLYVPHGIATTSPGLLYLHGGGFVICSPQTHDRLTRELAEGIGARVLSLDYALAPEHPYPHGLDDCEDAARWLHREGATLGIDPGRLVIGGDSAGASLAASVLLRLRDRDRVDAFRVAILLYGRYTFEDTDAIRAWGDRDFILSRKVMNWFADHYLGDRDRRDAYVAPLAADLRGLPPAVLVAGTLDPLVDDSRLLADALRRAGVEAELLVYPDGPHAFVQMHVLDMAADAVGKICAFARRHVGLDGAA